MEGIWCRELVTQVMGELGRLQSKQSDLGLGSAESPPLTCEFLEAGRKNVLFHFFSSATGIIQFFKYSKQP